MFRHSFAQVQDSLDGRAEPLNPSSSSDVSARSAACPDTSRDYRQMVPSASVRSSTEMSDSPLGDTNRSPSVHIEQPWAGPRQQCGPLWPAMRSQ